MNPLDHPVAFSYPLRIVDSAWLEHVPFGLSVVDIVRPRTLVELGAHNGVSYCAFCQAVKELSSDTRCYAIDTWRGDPQSGFYGEEVLAHLREHHDPLYGSFSRLVQSTFDEAVDHFEDGSIDLLHIDGYHTYDAVKHDWQTWLPKMSERGVVLLHDINVREGDFGAWKLWEELAPVYRHFEFTHGHGLGVVLFGEEVPGQLSELLDAGSENVSRIREFFYQLGRRVVLQQERQRSAEEVATRAEATGSAIRALSAQIAEKDRYAAELAAQMAEKDRYAAELAAQMAEKDRALRMMQARVTTYESSSADLQRTRQEVTVLSRKRDSLSDRLERIESRLTFRALERVWQTQMRIAPPQTRHGKLWVACTRFARRVIGQPPIPIQAGSEVMPELPYQQTLSDAAAVGRVLHRNDIYGSGPPVTTASAEVVSLIMSYGRGPMLDVGCGIGVYIAALAERGVSVRGIEVNEEYVSTAQTLNRDVVLYDGSKLPFDDGAFDTAIAIEVLEHIPDWHVYGGLNWPHLER